MLRKWYWEDVYKISKRQDACRRGFGGIESRQHGIDTGDFRLDRRGFAAVWCDHSAAVGKKTVLPFKT